jgi:sugar O-acyltransferase (sialic acid O-acetyltransferase NeuD family)
MKKPIVLFGSGKIAEVLLYFFREHSDREVVACCVDRDYLPGPRWRGLPTVAFDEVVKLHPPETHEMFVALGYQEMNALRQSRCEQARALGYTLVSYVHPQAGLPKNSIHGDNCFFMDRVMVHPYVRFGSNVFVWSGAMIGHHSRIGDNCWLTSSSQIGGGVDVGDNCFLALNATVGHSINIGARCFLGANALVTQSTLDEQVFVAQNSKPLRLTSQQFFRLSCIGDL